MKKYRAGIDVGSTTVKLVLLDEPTAYLDSQTRDAVTRAILRFAQGRALLVVTHDEDLAARCGRRVELQDGQIVSDAPVAAPAAGAAPGGHMATADGTASRAAVVGKEEDR